jgi:hypothetical protein
MLKPAGLLNLSPQIWLAWCGSIERPRARIGTAIFGFRWFLAPSLLTQPRHSVKKLASIGLFEGKKYAPQKTYLATLEMMQCDFWKAINTHCNYR